MIRFGLWSTTLGLAAAFGLIVALLLLLVGGRRTGNRLLAALLICTALKLMPYVLGFAGFYDAHPWLSFAPFDWGLGFGPLLYLYVLAMTGRPLPRGWLWHFAPLALAIAYTSAIFLFPLETKTAWNDSIHAAWISPIQTWLTFLSLGLYLAAAIRAVRQRRELRAVRRRMGWLLTMLAALAIWLAVAIAFEVADLLLDLDYYQRFPQYLAFAGIILALALESWRHAGAPATVAPAQDWQRLGQDWSATIRTGQWWREPSFSLGEAARRLGTNESYLSRAFNEGLGTGFAAVVNDMRVEAVKARLATGNEDILAIALDTGFSSKPSFNRAFKQATGMAPSEWRRRHVSQSRKAEIEAT